MLLLSASKAVSVTDLSYAAIGLLYAAIGLRIRVCYAMASTDMPYAEHSSRRSLSQWYQPSRMLCDARYLRAVWCYTLSGTDIANATIFLWASYAMY